MHSKKDSSIEGFTLRYTGTKINEHCDSDRGMETLRKNFSELGALAIRFQLSLAQFAALIQPVCEEKYEENSVECIAEGNNQSDLFAVAKDASQAAKETKLLEECSHYIIGKGKILNERSQPLRRPNTEGFRGGEAIWDIIHFGVWQTGICLNAHLTKQGFLYICYPEMASPETYASISRELANGEFELMIDHEEKVVKTKSGTLLQTSSIPSSFNIDLDPAHATTFQENGFVVKVKGKEAPFGWIIQEKNQKLVKQEHAEDLIRVIRISKSGFRRLPEAQGKLLMLGLMKGNEHILHTQNRSFNAMDILLGILESEYNFDPSALMNDTVMQRVYKQMQTFAEEKAIVDDLLTINLALEMVQPLKSTLAKSKRHPLLKHMTNSYPVNQNTIKAIIYAFDLERINGEPALSLAEDMTPTLNDESLIDVRINGQLSNPDLINPQNTAALLSIAILVSEQIIIEQLIRDAFRYGEGHPNAQALKEILGDPTLYEWLLDQVKTVPANEDGPILGLQFAYCEPIITRLRAELGSSHLIAAIQKLHNHEEIETDNANVITALEKLFKIGKTFQHLDVISGVDSSSRGINGGLILVIQKLTPSLFKTLNEHEKNTSLMPITTTQLESEHHKKTPVEMCPFLSGKLVDKTTHHHSRDVEKQELEKQQTGTWCGFFTKALVATAITAATVTIGSQFL